MRRKIFLLLAFLFSMQQIYAVKSGKITIAEGVTLTYYGKLDKKSNLPKIGNFSQLIFHGSKSSYSVDGYFHEINVMTNASLDLPSDWYLRGDTLRYEIQDSTVTFHLQKGRLYGYLSLTPSQKESDPTMKRTRAKIDIDDIDDGAEIYVTMSRTEKKIIDTNIPLLSKGYYFNPEKTKWVTNIYQIPSKCIGLDSIKYAVKGILLHKEDNQWSMVPGHIYMSDRLKPIYNEKEESVKNSSREGWTEETFANFDYVLDDKYIIKKDNWGTTLCDSNDLKIEFGIGGWEQVRYKKTGCDYEFGGALDATTGIVDLKGWNGSGTYQGKKIEKYHFGDEDKTAQIKLSDKSMMFEDWNPKLYTGMVYEDGNHSGSNLLIFMKDGEDMMPAYIAEKKQKEAYEKAQNAKLERVRKSLAGTKWTYSDKVTTYNGKATMNVNITLRANGRAVGTVTTYMNYYVSNYNQPVNMTMKIYVDIPWKVLVSENDESSYVVEFSRDDFNTKYEATGSYTRLLSKSERALFEYSMFHQFMSKLWGYFPLGKNYQNIGGLKRAQ